MNQDRAMQVLLGLTGAALVMASIFFLWQLAVSM